MGRKRDFGGKNGTLEEKNYNFYRVRSFLNSHFSSSMEHNTVV